MAESLFSNSEPILVAPTLRVCDPEEYKIFRERILRFIRARKYSDEEATEMLASCLEGEAAKRFKCSNTNCNFFTLLLRLDYLFLPRTENLIARIKFHMGEQGEDEALAGFHQRMFGLWKLGFPDFAPDIVAVWRFVEGIRNKEVVEFLQQTQSHTWDDILPTAEAANEALERKKAADTLMREVEQLRKAQLKACISRRQRILLETRQAALSATTEEARGMYTHHSYLGALQAMLRDFPCTYPSDPHPWLSDPSDTASPAPLIPPPALAIPVQLEKHDPPLPSSNPEHLDFPSSPL
jgi:hypothetical protein